MSGNNRKRPETVKEILDDMKKQKNSVNDNNTEYTCVPAEYFNNLETDDLGRKLQQVGESTNTSTYKTTAGRVSSIFICLSAVTNNYKLKIYSKEVKIFLRHNFRKYLL